MKNHVLVGLCLLVTSSHAYPLNETREPIGERFGLSAIEVVDSILKEGFYRYSDASVKPGTPTTTFVQFRHDEAHQLLSYSFENDKCQIGMLTLPITQLDSIVQVYDQFPSIGKQMWRGPHGLIKLTVAIGNESVRRDHKPHITVFYDSRR